MKLEATAKIASGATCLLVVRGAAPFAPISLEVTPPPPSLKLFDVKIGNLLVRLVRLPEDPAGRWYFAKQGKRVEPMVDLTVVVRNETAEPVDAKLVIFGAGIGGAP